jgi:hypothetical protein
VLRTPLEANKKHSANTTTAMIPNPTQLKRPHLAFLCHVTSGKIKRIDHGVHTASERLAAQHAFERALAEGKVQAKLAFAGRAVLEGEEKDVEYYDVLTA